MEKIADNIIKTYTVSELIERYTQLLTRNEELQKENRELRRQLENKETPETSEIITKPVQPDYDVVKDNNGRIWYKRTHINAQRKESRLLEKYDVIVAKRDLEEPYPTIMLIDSFDYESDFAARCFYGKSVYYEDFERKKHTEMWYGGFAPCLAYFSFATHEEIEELFDKINESSYLYGECITNKEIKERYSEYLD